MKTAPIEVKKKAIVLLSGGLDSTTCLAIAQSQGYECHTLSFDYGQKHCAELTAAQQIAKHYHAKHHIINLSLSDLSGSALTNPELDVPDHQGSTDIPITYVPARNTVFLSLALGLAETIQAHHIFIGVSAIDYSGYPDCRPEYIDAFQTMANLATKMGIEGNGITIETPLIQLSKKETIQRGMALNVDYQQTISCYRANSEGLACGKCDSCILRKKGFSAASIDDQTKYAI